VVQIGKEAFESCYFLKKVILSNSITEIPEMMFSYCQSLQEIIIPNFVTRIGMEAFENCDSLTNLLIPNSVKCIESLAFWECTSLTQVNFLGIVENIAEDIFEGCSSLSQILIPSGTLDIYKEMIPDLKDKLVEQDEEEEICLACCSEDSQACEDKEYALWQPHSKIIKKNGKLGVVIDDGTTKKQIIPFNYDTWFNYDGYETDIRENFFDDYLDYIGYFAIKNSDGTFTIHGYDKDGTLTTSFTCEKFNPDSYSLHGKYILRYTKDGVEYDGIVRMGYYYGQLGNDNCYFALRKGGKWSLVSDDLKDTYIDYIECDRFQEIGWAPHGYYAILVKEDKYKLCIGKKDGQPLTLPNEYDNIIMRYCMTNDGCRVEGLCFTIRKGRKWAVCSNDLLQLSPFIFDDVGNMINSNSITVIKELNNRKVELVYNIDGDNAWNIKDLRPFSIDEIEAVKRAEVVPSQYGNSVCFFMKSGGQTYIPLYEKSSLTPGDVVDLKTALFLTLCRKGNDDIYRVME
jgi:hypothetical protein